MSKSTKNALAALQQLTETQFSSQYVEPLLQKLHPGAQIEGSHGVLEAGRDIICLTSHPVLTHRKHILCVQVKNHALSPGATTGPYSFASIEAQVHTARTTPVVLPNGDSVSPDEVWVVTGHPLPEGPRRAGQALLKEIESHNGKIIDGTEVLGLLQRHCPNLLAELEQWADHKLARTIVALSVHQESRAFGLRVDRALDDFHINASICPSGTLTRLLLEEGIESFQYSESASFRASKETAARMPENGNDIVRSDLQYSRSLRVMAALAEAHSVPVSWKTDVIQVKVGEDGGHRRTGEKRRQDEEELPFLIKRTYAFDLPSAVVSARKELKQGYRRIPKRLTKNVKRVAEVVSAITRAEAFLQQCKALDAVRLTEPKTVVSTPVFLVGEEEDLLGLGRFLLVEGGPGAGKTTLLRRLAAGILKRGEHALYVNAASLTPEDASDHSDQVILQNLIEGTPKEWLISNSVLVIDGLDEAPFSLDAIILALAKDAQQVIVSCRSAYETSLRSQFARLELAPFPPGDRDRFFSRWFSQDPTRLERTMAIVHGNPDLDMHSRVPLIATIVAALVERGFEPTTRTEIYKDRLRLLLGDWDQIRGVRRGSISPIMKIRFLEQLAFDLHNASGRRRRFSMEDCRRALLSSLGNRGKNISAESMVRELVVAAGVIVQEPSGYSFGHLSFQEHLAGQYLCHKEQPKVILDKLGDDWWREVLRFYAGSRGEITDVIDLAEEQAVTAAHVDQLRDLVAHAPYTEEVAVSILRSTSREVI